MVLCTYVSVMPGEGVRQGVGIFVKCHSQGQHVKMPYIEVLHFFHFAVLFQKPLLLGNKLLKPNH